jgi:cell division protein FtsZ
MISFPKYLDRSQTPVVRLVGLGNAGVNLADRITMAGVPGLETVAINSDQQSLSSSVSPVKVSLGPLTTRGLGAGGDPEIGLDAAKESLSEIEEALAGSDIIFLCAGLGGGTASGAGGMVAEAAKQTGALLIAIVTTPFGFEGRRRTSQAAAAVQEISAHADAVIHFENDRMAELAAPKSGVAETFAACDELLCGCISAVAHLISARGPLGVGLPDLLSVLNAGSGGCLFGTGASAGDNRAHEALERALKSPLLDRGRLLDEAASVLVHLSGPPSLSFAEVGAIMQEIARQASEGSMLHLGVSTVQDTNAPVVVTILAKAGAAAAAAAPAARPRPSPAVERPPKPRPARVEPEPELPAGADPSPAHETAEAPEPEPLPEPAPVRHVPPPRPAAQQPQPHSATKPAPPKIKQETLQFEPVARGRFEKIEPTIVEGEDLDVPTFLRLNVKKP